MSTDIQEIIDHIDGLRKQFLRDMDIEQLNISMKMIEDKHMPVKYNIYSRQDKSAEDDHSNGRDILGKVSI